jgi:hypothetical protein
MKSVRIAALLVLGLGRPAWAMVLEVPVPQLTGTYSCSNPVQPESVCHKTVVIHLPVVPAAIQSVSLRVSGTTTFGWFQCEFAAPHAQPTQIYAELLEPGSAHDYWDADHTNVAGAIAYTQPFASGLYANGTWTFLLDGTATLDFAILSYSPIPECGYVGPPDSTTLDAVTLLIDGDFPTPVAHRSWGSLKAIYR